MKKVSLFLSILLLLVTGSALADPCPAKVPTSRADGTTAGLAGTGGVQYSFEDALLDGFDCFEELSSWFPSYIHSTNAVSSDGTTVDMAYTDTGTATFSNVVAPTSGSYLLTIRYAYAQGLFPGVTDRPEGIMVNGIVVTSNMHFPVTGDFDTFQNSSIVVFLNAGKNTVRLFNVASPSISRADTLTISALPSGSDGCVLYAPNVTAGTGSGVINLNWNSGGASQGCTVDHYNVYRSTTAEFAPSNSNLLAGAVIPTSYSDSSTLCGTTYYYVVEAATANSADQTATSTEASAATSACPIISSIAINAQGPAIGSFLADEDFAGGGLTSHPSNPVDLSGVTSPAPTSVYPKARSGNFTYTIPNFVPGSTHTIRFHFDETFWGGAGERTFDVSINGTQVLTNFDIFAAAGGAKNKAVIEQFTEPASSTGQYVLTFTSVTDKAMVSGIEIQ